MISSERSKALIARLNASDYRGVALRSLAMALLDELPTYNWSGIYRLEGDILALDAYVGAETDHTHIPVGRGVCGTAVAENRNQVIRDVRELTNYLGCSLQTRSEIVVLIKRGEQMLGQIDIDGHSIGAFDKSDEALLEAFAEIIADRWED